jgi:hypothetical protein
MAKRGSGGSSSSVVACFHIEACVWCDGMCSRRMRVFIWLVWLMCIDRCGVSAYSLSGLCA